MEKRGSGGLESRSPYVKGLQKEAAIIASKVLSNDLGSINSLIKGVDKKDIDRANLLERYLSPCNDTKRTLRALEVVEKLKPQISIPMLADAICFEETVIRKYAASAIGRIAENAYRQGDTTTVSMLLPTAIKLTEAIEEIKGRDYKEIEEQTLETLNESLDIIIYGEKRGKKTEIH